MKILYTTSKEKKYIYLLQVPAEIAYFQLLRKDNKEELNYFAIFEKSLLTLILTLFFG